MATAVQQRYNAAAAWRWSDTVDPDEEWTASPPIATATMALAPTASTGAPTITRAGVAAATSQLRRTLAAGVARGVAVGAAQRLWTGSPVRPTDHTRADVAAVQEDEVTRRIGQAVDSCSAAVDLSELALEFLPPEVASLRHYNPGILQQARDRGLSLFLSRNCFAAFPRRLLCLEQLTVLSLRGNKIRELPAEIRLLRNLRELSVGSNLLTHLPAEVEALPALQTLHAQPNPFAEPAEPPAGPAVPTLLELCLRELHVQRMVPGAYTEHELAVGSDAVRQPLDRVEACLKAAPGLDEWPRCLAAQALQRHWCKTCDAIVVTPTCVRIRRTDVKGSVRVAVRYIYCSAACAAAHASQLAAAAGATPGRPSTPAA